MKTRRFRAYAEKEDLQHLFKEFESKFNVFYVPSYSDEAKISYGSIMDLERLGMDDNGSCHGKMQMLIFFNDTECLWRAYQCRGEHGEEIARYSAIGTENSAFISADFRGVCKENTIFPTEISTMYYEQPVSKRLYDELKKIFRKQAVKIVNGYYICPNAYANREKYRFCTIDIKSPPEYDLKVE